MRHVTIAAIVVAGLAIAVPAHAEGKTGIRVALGAMAIGQGLDTLSTVQALNRGAVETNPLMGQQPSAVKLVVGKLPMIGIGWLLVKLAPHHPKLAKGTAYVIGAVGTGLALSNMRSGQKERGQ